MAGVLLLGCHAHLRCLLELPNHTVNSALHLLHLLRRTCARTRPLRANEVDEDAVAYLANPALIARESDPNAIRTQRKDSTL